jgi:glycosyltransferase involved in cell wall biosynthesis
MRTRLFVHPAIRTYREPLYARLGAEGVEFLWTSVNTDRPHELKEVQTILARFPYPNRIASDWRFLGVSNFTPQLVHAFRYDDVILSSATSVPFLLLAGPLAAMGKRVFLFDELWRYQHEVPRYAKLLPLVRTLVRSCTHAIITAGTKSRDLFVDQFGVPSARVHVAYNTTVDLSRDPGDIGRKHAVTAKVAELAAGRVTLLYLGRIVRYKGLDVLIRAMSRLPSNASLMVVGSGPFEAECKALATDLRVDDRVHFLGPCDSSDAVHYYGACDLFVLPTRFLLTEPVNCESWGFTVNEAMSLGVPVVATTAVGAAYDLIVPGETGAMAEAGDPDDLAAKLAPLVADAELRRRIGAAGRERLARVCSYDQSFAAFREALQLR